MGKCKKSKSFQQCHVLFSNHCVFVLYYTAAFFGYDIFLFKIEFLFCHHFVYKYVQKNSMSSRENCLRIKIVIFYVLFEYNFMTNTDKNA